MKKKSRAPIAAIAPTSVRYIKLGRAGEWEAHCESEDIIRLGFGIEHPDRFRFCRAGRWSDLSQSFIAKGRSKGTAKRFTNETRHFFEDRGTTLWITFNNERLLWGLLDPSPAEIHPDGQGVFRRVAGGWRDSDVRGEPLTKTRLSGGLVKLTAYRGTSCNVDCADYVVKRINGEKNAHVEAALVAQKALREATTGVMRLLGDRDFETLVDLIFSTSGWRRLGTVGSTRKMLDLDLELPSTGQRAFVQVKSMSNSKELARYVAQIDKRGPHERMFYAFHSGTPTTDDERVTLLGPEKLAEMVVDAGLTGWIINKVS